MTDRAWLLRDGVALWQRPEMDLPGRCFRDGGAAHTGTAPWRARVGGPHDIALSYNLGVNTYVAKPIDFDSLAALARAAGCYWLAINRPPA